MYYLYFTNWLLFLGVSLYSDSISIVSGKCSFQLPILLRRGEHWNVIGEELIFRVTIKGITIEHEKKRMKVLSVAIGSKLCMAL